MASSSEGNHHRHAVIHKMRSAVQQSRREKSGKRIRYLVDKVRRGTAEPQHHMELMQRLSEKYQEAGDVDKAYSYRFLFFLTKSSIIKFTIDLPEPHELTKRVSRKDENDPTKDLIETKTCSIESKVKLAKSLRLTVWSCFSKHEQRDIRSTIEEKEVLWATVYELPRSLYKKKHVKLKSP